MHRRLPRQLHPSSKSTKAFARRVTREATDPSRANAISLLRSSSLRKPPRQHCETSKFAKPENSRIFYRDFNEFGVYIERWIKAPMVRDGMIIERTRRTPQGGVISPILSNLFLHYTFDLWMKRTHPDLPWCRYADDGLVHCRTEQEAEALRAELQARLEECRLEMHPTKTKIVYCKDGKRKGTYPNVTFDFLGYQFRPRMVRSSRNGQLFCSFTPAVSPSSLKAIRSTVRDLNIPQLTVRSLDDIARMLNPLLRGWIQYYGRYNPAALEIMLRYVNLTVLRWVMRKFKRFQGRKVGAANFLEKLVRIQPSLFEHWRIRMIGAFA